jgi:hypothetical protein
VFSFHLPVVKHSLLLYSVTEYQFNENLQPRTVSIAEVVGLKYLQLLYYSMLHRKSVEMRFLKNSKTVRNRIL